MTCYVGLTYDLKWVMAIHSNWLGRAQYKQVRRTRHRQLSVSSENQHCDKKRSMTLLLQAFECKRDALAAADTHRDDAVATA